ncbi:phenol hydroxylase subunit P4 [Pseudomonas sp. R5(2019)]|uniref:phenol hydroxylase subunit P4 n=1 Tax=Pseudomonas sp. R5(2019) TaxID=2697566 RepID=UPI001412EF46|nr:phenol hydroxylase subunit P4 [Pseudomonas sp. R5(2019)]NBA93491.1 phenol hydroxylase [Pseudomonas sp. R5(2019)]
MSVTALHPYPATALDLQQNFHGAQLVYLCWERHLLFCAPFTFPLPPSLGFADFIEQVLKPAVSQHPEAAQIDFGNSRWRLDGQPFVPDFAASLEANGIGHKSLLHLDTPGLNGLAGTCN